MTEKVDSTSTASVIANSQPARGWAVAHQFLSLVRFSHTVFALPFALLACVMAMCQFPRVEMSGPIFALNCGLVVVCMVTARNAAMAFNRLVDVDVDRENPRTAGRHLVTGILTQKQVFVFWLLNGLLFVGACVGFWPNWLPVALAVPVLAWLCGYSYAKRFTAAAHLWLGVALALSPLCVWVALRGQLVIGNSLELATPMVLSGAIAFWVAGFDIIYACQDADYDRDKGLFSVPAYFGIAGGLRIAAVLHLLMLAILAALPLVATLSLSWIYWVAYGAVGVLVVRQHLLVRPDDLSRVGQAFFQINAIISLGFCSLVALDCLI